MKKTYKIILEKRVSKKDLSVIPVAQKIAVLVKIQSLSDNPYPRGCEKLSGYEPVTYRVRQGVYRILYRVLEEVIEIRVIHVGHRREIYKK